MTVIAPLFGGDNSSPSTSATNWNYLTAQALSNFNATETNRSLPVPIATTLSALYVAVDVAPGTGASYTFTVYKNGAATALSATISGAALSAADSVNSVSFAAGDTVSIAIVPSGTPATVTNTTWSVRSMAAGQIIAGANTTLISTTAVNYLNPFGTGTTSATYYTTVGDAEVIVATPGVFSDLRMLLLGSPGTGKNYTATLTVNGVDSALTVVVADAATVAADSTHTVAVVTGDRVALKVTPTGTPTGRGPKIALAFTPTDTNLSWFGFAATTAPSTTATNYEQPTGLGAASWATTATSRNQLAIGDFAAKSLRLVTGTSPTQTHNFTLTKNGAATALTIALTGANTSGTATADVTFAAGDRVTLQADPVAVPSTVTSVKTSFVVSSVIPAPPSGSTTGLGNFFAFL